MKKPAIQHRDKLGRDINLDDCVVLPSHNNLCIGKVVKINPKMIGIKEVGNQKWLGSWNKYPNDVLVVDHADVTLYLLKN